MADLTEISKLGVGRARTACLLGPTQRRRLPLFHVHFFNGSKVGFNFGSSKAGSRGRVSET
jgi:hypothetical protein